MSHQPLLARTFRWLWVITVLMLLFASAAPAAPARAQTGFYIEVKLFQPKTIICLGQSVPYLAELWRSHPVQAGDPPESLLRPLFPGTTMEATSTNSNAGVFTNSRVNMSNSPSPELIRPSYVEFTFVAKKIGRTTLIFSATVDGREAISYALDVTVQPCKFTVFAKSKWFYADSGYTLSVVATTTRIEMVIDDRGGYTGGGEVVYLSASSSIAGHGVVGMGTGTVGITGYVDQNDQLAVKLIYGPTTLSQTSVGLDYTVPVEVETLNGFLIYSAASVFSGDHIITVNGVRIGGQTQIFLIVKEGQ